MLDEKQLAGEQACQFIREGMIVGLGTGRTVYYTAGKLAELIKAGLTIRVVSTSKETTRLCQSLKIPLISLSEISQIDLTIDGADHIDAHFHGIKGGHGALLLEKIVAMNSRTNIWVVDSSKVVNSFKDIVLPLEVCPVGYRQLLEKLNKKGFVAHLRSVNGEPFLTDFNNYIIDLYLPKLPDPFGLNLELKLMTGVFETGLFLNLVNRVVVGQETEAIVLPRP